MQGSTIFELDISPFLFYFSGQQLQYLKLNKGLKNKLHYKIFMFQFVISNLINDKHTKCKI